jgi:hypothetical protein
MADSRTLSKTWRIEVEGCNERGSSVAVEFTYRAPRFVRKPDIESWALSQSEVRGWSVSFVEAVHVG